MATAATQTAAREYTGVFPGEPREVANVRGEVRRFLAARDVPQDTADTCILVVSELATNGILHSDSGGTSFAVGVSVHADCVYIEVADRGGTWRYSPRHDDDRPGGHGLDLVRGLTGNDDFGVDGGPSGRAVWARVRL